MWFSSLCVQFSGSKLLNFPSIQTLNLVISVFLAVSWRGLNKAGFSWTLMTSLIPQTSHNKKIHTSYPSQHRCFGRFFFFTPNKSGLIRPFIHVFDSGSPFKVPTWILQKPGKDKQQYTLVTNGNKWDFIPRLFKYKISWGRFEKCTLE